MKIPKEELKKELHKDFIEFVKDREEFVDSLAPDYNKWRCPKHNILISNDCKCPECEHEKRTKKHQKEIMDKGFFGKQNANIEEQKQNADQIKEKRNNQYTKNLLQSNLLKRKKYKENEEWREYQIESVKKSSQKNRIRKLEHSI
jgi:hypothetical protein